MKKQNGFIATSLLYTFFLAFITLFIGMITIYLQNRVYLTKFEDSSKNSIYIREMKDLISTNGDTTIYINNNARSFRQVPTDNIFITTSGIECNLAKCEIIYYNGSNYKAEGCPDSCE